MCQICVHKLGKVPNLYGVQIQQRIKFDHCSNLAKCQICVHKLGNVPNLHVQIRQSAKIVRTNQAKCQICTVFKFSRVSNLITAQIWQCAKFARTNQARCQICAYKLGKVPNLYNVQFQQSVKFDHRSNLAKCQICAHKLGKVPNLRAKIRQGAKFIRSSNIAEC